MRHRKKFNHLSRTSSHRKAMLSNMATSLILHKRIHTTVAKAKALKVYVEPLITRSKEDTTHNRRMVFAHLRDKKAVTELFREVSVKVADRPGGYTRILKTGNRLGDNADMCFIELVDFNDLYTVEKKAAKKSTRRSRRGGAPKTQEAQTETAVAEEVAVEEAPAVEEVEAKAEETEAPAEEPTTEEADNAEEKKAE